MKRQSARTRKTIAYVGAGLLIAAIAIAAWPRDPLLMERAHRIFTYGNHDEPGCLWLSDHEFVFEQMDPSQKWIVVYYEMTSHRPHPASKPMEVTARKTFFQMGMDYQKRSSILEKQTEVQTGGRTLIQFGRFGLALPSHSTVVDFAESKAHPELVWLVKTEDVPSWARILRPIAPGFANRYRRTAYDLWISRADGSQLRRSGRLAISSDTQSYREIRNLQWAPGGRRVSFDYQNVLRTLDIK